MTKHQKPFGEFSIWLQRERNRSKSSTYVTCSQIRSIVRNCLNKEKKYKINESDLKKMKSQQIDFYISNMPQKNRSPFKRSWKLLEEFMNVESVDYIEENKDVVAILKKYRMRNPVNWRFTGEVIGGKHLLYNTSFDLRRAIDEKDFEILRNGRKLFIKQKIWLSRVK